MLALYHNQRGIQLHHPDTILDVPDEAFSGLLTPLQLARLRDAILADIHETIRRKHAGQVARAEQANLVRKLIDDLYVAKGGGLEQAVTDIFNHLGVPAARILRQPHGEEDIRVTHADGTVIISVTASQDDTRPVRWNKAKEILGAGAGLNPVNYVCVGRPDFESLAQRSAENIAREAGHRSILLVPIPVLAEAAVRIAEGSLDSRHLVDLLAHRRGNLAVDDLSEGEVEGDIKSQSPDPR
jgi:hypothetical protein